MKEKKAGGIERRSRGCWRRVKEYEDELVGADDEMFLGVLAQKSGLSKCNCPFKRNWPLLLLFNYSFLPSVPFTLHVNPSSLPGSRAAPRPTYQIPTPASPSPPLLSTSSRGMKARLKSPLSRPSDCLSLSSARRFLLLQMDDWSG